MFVAAIPALIMLALVVVSVFIAAMFGRYLIDRSTRFGVVLFAAGGMYLGVIISLSVIVTVLLEKFA